jgi:hypothetical protein
MFFDGALQQGISKAVDQQKLVLCFVTGKLEPYTVLAFYMLTSTDENDESLQWETEFLQDESVSSFIPCL